MISDHTATLEISQQNKSKLLRLSSPALAFRIVGARTVRYTSVSKSPEAAATMRARGKEKRGGCTVVEIGYPVFLQHRPPPKLRRRLGGTVESGCGGGVGRSCARERKKLAVRTRRRDGKRVVRNLWTGVDGHNRVGPLFERPRSSRGNVMELEAPALRKDDSRALAVLAHYRFISPR
jgi:hypothetical protein